MNNTKVLFCCFFCFSLLSISQAQEFNHQFIDEQIEEFHHIENDTHTSVKPILFEFHPYRDISLLFSDKKYAKYLNQNLIDVQTNDFKLIINPLFNFVLGKEGEDGTFVNTRAFEAKGVIGGNTSFYSSFYENQAIFPRFLEDHIWENEMSVPGQGQSRWYDRNTTRVFDFAMANGHVSHQLSKHFNFQFGHGKHFLGDGYRSIFLSDHSFNYPYFKITTDVWKVKYVNLFSSYQDLRDEFSLSGVNRKKFSTIHYLSYNVSSRLNISMFEAIVWEQDTLGRGFDVNYLNPIIFYRPIEFSLGSKGGNAMMGVSSKLKLSNSTHLYSQFMIDEFKLSELSAANGWWANKYAGQIGMKYYDVFKVDNLFLQGELNFSRPFMYSHARPLQSYTHYNQPLAHPLGASFVEGISILRYRAKRIYSEFKYLYAKHGEEIAGDETNYGSNVLISYNDGERHQHGNFIAQGNTTDLQMIDFKVGMLLNPHTNMKLELGVLNRKTASLYGSDTNTTHIYIAFKTDLRNLYYDF